MFETLMAQPKETAWLVATGSLTNVGLLLRKYPEVTAHLKGISIMGGSFGEGFTDAPLSRVNGEDRVGNIGLWAEFNMLIDPEAAAEVFHNKEVAKKTTLVPLDLSHLVLATEDVRKMLLYGPDAKAEGTGTSTLRRMLVELLYFFAGTYEYALSTPCVFSRTRVLHIFATSLTGHSQQRLRYQRRPPIARPHSRCRAIDWHSGRDSFHGMARKEKCTTQTR